MRRLVFIILATLFASTVYAQSTCTGASALLSWTPPTQNTDGSALTNLAGYRVHYGTNSNTLSSVIQLDNAGLTAYCVTGLTPATYYFGLKAFTSTGAESALSNVVTKTVSNVPITTPAPPVLTVAATEVFQVVGVEDRFQLLPVGTVPPTTQCIGTQSINGHYAVPRAAVTWYGNVRPKVVVAKCNG